MIYNLLNRLSYTHNSLDSLQVQKKKSKSQKMCYKFAVSFGLLESK